MEKKNDMSEKMIPDYVVREIKELSPEVLAAHDVIFAASRLINRQIAYICPVCENGTGEDGTGIQPKCKDDGIWLYHCFRCDKTFDNIHLLAIHYGLDAVRDFGQICRRACEEFGIYIRSDYSDVRRSKSYCRSATESNDQKELAIINDDICQARGALTKLPAGARRGLTLDTLEYFHCGFISNWVHPTCRVRGIKGVPTPRLIIPSGNHYLARLIVDENTYAERERKYIIPKQHAGKKSFFNFDNISSDSGMLNIVVEGEIDAMSIWQATSGNVPVVAIAGVAGQKKFVNQIDRKFGKSESKPRFLILFDPDNAGRNAAEKLKTEMQSAGFAVVVRFLTEGTTKTDANDILLSEGNQKLSEIIYSMVNDSNRELEEKIVEAVEEKGLDERIKKWVALHGEIQPETLTELRNSVAYIRSLTTEKITYSIAVQSKTCCALTQCQYYDFYSGVSDKFFERLKEAKKRATQILKNIKPDEPMPQGISGLDFITKKDITDKIKAYLPKVIKQHKDYVTRLKEEAEAQQRRTHVHEQEARRQNNVRQLEELHKQPASPERNERIIQLIQDSCSWKKDRSGKRTCVQPTITNYDIIFTYDPVIAGLFALDRFQHAIVLMKQPPWNKEVRPRETWWSDEDDANMRTYIRRYYGAIANDSLYHDTFISYAWAHAFHPVREYLTNLPAWDGKPRAETLLVDFLKANDTEYSRAVTMNWLLGAVSRAFHPGCEFQTALVLQGAQGTGKSFLAKMLGGKWHDSLKDSVEDPHALDVIRGSWIVELEEFWPADKANVNALKSFISSSVDTRREAYARRAMKYFRQCVFIITSNEKYFLKDRTGNRRFIIVTCNSKTFEYTKGLNEEYIQQVWAEVMVKYNELFKDGFDEKKLELPREIRYQAEDIAESFVANDSIESEIKAFLNVQIPPSIIFKILTQYERNRFFMSHSIMLENAEWQKRRELLTPKEKIEFDKAISDKKFIRQTQKSAGGRTTYYTIVYGSVLRMETCATEILNECFENSRRKDFRRINEILCSLSTWTLLDKRDRNFHNCYGDQKRIYGRVVTPDTEDDSNTATQ